MTHISPQGALLQAELYGLRTEADSVRHQIKVSSAVERKFYAKAYLWWRKARDEKDFLADEYNKKGIAFKAGQNSISWRPLLKLVTDKMITKTDLDIWSRAFGVIHDDFDQDPGHYVHDPVGQIDYFIESRGGKTGVAGYHPKTTKVDEDDTTHTPEDAILFYDLNEDVIDDVFLELARDHYGHSPANALSPTSSTEFTADGFSLALLRRGSHGTEQVKTTALTNLVTDVLTNCYRADFEAAPLSLRCILEPLHIANVPLSISKSRDRFVEFAKLQAVDGAKDTVRTSRLLTYRYSIGDLLLSMAHVNSSVVVHATPNIALVSDAIADLVLLPYLRRSIEVRLLHQQMFNAFASPSAAFSRSVDLSVHRHLLSLPMKAAVTDYLKRHEINQQQASRFIRNLRHDSISLVAPTHGSLPLSQPQFNAEQFTGSWLASVTHEWLRRTVTAFFDLWIVEYGIKANRPMNRVLALYMDENFLHVGYELGSQTGFDSYKELPMDAGAIKGKAQIVVRSVDLTFVLRQICDLPITGQIDLEASNKALVLRFETDACRYAVAIPASDEAGIRRSDCFSKYTISQEPAAEDDYFDNDAEGMNVEV